jgi:hypothetical protein
MTNQVLAVNANDESPEKIIKQGIQEYKNTRNTRIQEIQEYKNYNIAYSFSGPFIVFLFL